MAPAASRVLGGPRALVGLGVGVAAAGAAAAVGVATDRLVRERRALSSLAEPSAYDHTPHKEVVVVADDGVPLHVEIDEPHAEAARPGNPTIVFSHGYCLTLASWVLQRKALAAAGYRVVLWDQRGHGKSGRGEPESCRIDQLGRDLERVVAEVVPEGHIALVGHSMGGMTMMALAEQFPELIRERVVAAAFIATSAGGGQLVSLGFGDTFGRLIARVGPGLLGGLNRQASVLHRLRRFGRDVEDFFVNRYSFASPVSPAAVKLTGDMIFGTPFDVMADFLPTFDEHDKRELLVHFHGIEALVLNGADDILTPPDHSAEIVRRLPGAEHVVVEDAGHIVTLEHPEVVTEQLIALVDRGQRAVEEGIEVERKPKVRSMLTDIAKQRRIARARMLQRRGRRATEESTGGRG